MLEQSYSFGYVGVQILQKPLRWIPYSEAKKISQFAKYVAKEFTDELRQFLEDYEKKRLREKKDWIEKVFFHMIKNDPDMKKEDNFNLKQVKDKFLELESLVSSLFSLHQDDNHHQ